MKTLLGEIGAHKRGEKAAWRAIAFLCESGVLEDTGRVMKPKRSVQAVARAEKFQRMNGKRGSSVATEGGRTAQPTRFRWYWWRVFRVSERVLPRPLGEVWKRTSRGSRSLSARESQEEISEAAPPLAPESGLPSVGLRALGAAMSGRVSPARTGREREGERNVAGGTFQVANVSSRGRLARLLARRPW
jgi:hypothetical protein